MRRARILTLGHSNRALPDFVALLLVNEVKTLADVRTLRRSRAMPQFGEGRLRSALQRKAIRYLAIPELGGLRKKSPQPMPRPCWRNSSFRNYADHVRSAEFKVGIKKLLAEARRGRIAVMCAEAVPWRCHRGLIGDYLVVEKHRRVDELVGDRPRPHRLTVCARVVGGHLRYDLPARTK